MENNRKHENNPIKHLADGVYTKQEAKEALKLLRDKENDTLIDKQMSNVWDQIQNSSDSDIYTFNHESEEAEKLLKRINKIPFYKKYIKHSIVAASIAILIGIGIIGYEHLSPISDSAMLYTEVSTSFGETREITLPDGSVVILNACTHISYPTKFAENERLIKLDGEAYFQVVKNDKQPFVVNTDNFDVKVLGTVFNVRAYDGDEILSVNVESGKVQVDMPDAMSRLSKNEQIVINTLSNNYAKEDVQNEDVAPWRTGDLYFSNAPIKDVAKQLERIYNYSIVFQDGQEFNNLISGEHDEESLEEILGSIQLATGIKWKAGKQSKEIVLYR